MGDSAMVVRHASRVIKSVRGEQRATVASHVAKSWNRCLTEYGMQPSGARATHVLEAAALRERQQRMGELLGVARAEMESLYDQISGSGYAVILADGDATILHTITDPTLKREFRHAGLWHGALWDERHEGTNGIGTCVAEHSSVTVHRDEHFMGYNVGLSCSGAPIIDAHGDLLGVLDASSANCGDTRLIQRHTIALVTMSAKLISRFHFLREYPDAFVLQFHSRPEFVGLLHEALIAIDRDGTVLAVNESALAQLGHPDRSKLVGRSIEAAFQFAFTTLEQRAATDPRTIWPIRDVAHGRRFFALVRSPRAAAGSRRRFCSSEPPIRMAWMKPNGAASGAKSPGHASTAKVSEAMVAMCRSHRYAHIRSECSMPGAVSRTSTYALNNVTLPHALKIADLGWKEAMRQDPHLAQGLNVHAGRVTYPAVAAELGYDVLPIEEAIA